MTRNYAACNDLNALEAIHARAKSWCSHHVRGGHAGKGTEPGPHGWQAMLLRAIHQARTTIQRNQSILLAIGKDGLLKVAWLLMIVRRWLLLPASLKQTAGHWFWVKLRFAS